MKPFQKKNPKRKQVPVNKDLPSAYFSPAIPIELEKRICADPQETAHWKTLTRWLQRHGYLRGEFAKSFIPKKTQDEAFFLDILQKYAPYFTGKIEPVQHQFFRVENQEHFLQQEQLSSDIPIVFDWYYGYIYRARLGFNRKMFLQQHWKPEQGPNLLLEEFLRLDSARFTRFLTLGSFHFAGKNNYSTELQQLANSRPLKCLEGLYLGDFLLSDHPLSWSSSGDVGILSGIYSQLKILLIRAGDITLSKINFPQLQTLMLITGGITQKGIEGLQTGIFPELKHLEIYIGAKEYGKNCKISDFHFLFFETKRFPKLKYLGIKNAENQQEFLVQILYSPILKQLEILDCSMGTLGDEDVFCLLQNASKLSHLKYLDLRYNSLKNISILQESLPCPIRGLPQNRIDFPSDRCIFLGD